MKQLFLVDKPEGWTSFDVVAKIRGVVRANYLSKGIKPTKRQLKVGHAGTLDPFATGLLVVLLGDACSQADTFLKLDKVYETTIELGKTSSTGDPEGALSIVSDYQPRLHDIEKALELFTGEIQQVPPAFSAIKIDGKRAYELARAGKAVDIPTRQVTIHSLDLLAYDYPFVTVRAHVSSGTYIRTLAEDIGKELKTGAYCKALRRTRIGEMSVQDAFSVDKVLAEIKLNNDN